MGIEPSLLHERHVIARLDNAAAVENDDPVAILHHVEPVGNEDDRTALADQAEVVLDGPLRFIIQGACRLVEDDEPRLVMSARAIEILWRWPPESDTPLSSTMLS